MINLNSFDELELPIGLFPDNCNFYIEEIAKKSISYIGDIELDVLNEKLNYYYLYFSQTLKALKSREGKNTLKQTKEMVSSKIKSIHPSNVAASSDYMMYQLADITKMEKVDSIDQSIADDKEYIEKINSTKIEQSIMALYFYILAVNKAKRLLTIKSCNNNSFYRLGRVSNYIQFANVILKIPEAIENEINALEKREKGFEKKKKSDASKGGKSKNNKFNEIKTKCINIYIKSHMSRSNRDASNRIYDSLSESDKSVFRGDDPAHQIAVWIGQYNQGKLKND